LGIVNIDPRENLNVEIDLQGTSERMLRCAPVNRGLQNAPRNSI
jgi:hypothetical protein